jgi:hypothetical protein
MNTLQKLRDRLFNALGFADSVVGGTLTTVDPKDKYPVFIANEGLGGLHVYDSLEELATTIPVARMQKGMQAVVNEHTSKLGTKIKRTIYILENIPNGVDYISQVPEYNISAYWKVFEAVSDFEGAVETQYAPNIDKLSGQAVLVGGGSPPFPGSKGSRAVSLEQYDSLIVGTNVTFTDGGTPSIVAGYWANSYDSTKGHEWMRTKIGLNSTWSNPIRVAGEYADAGDYIENRFKWEITQPLTPSMRIDGRLNNEPAGWSDGPEERVVGSKLWMIKCQKDVYQQIKTPWTPPIEIKIDGTLVRYSEKATPNPNDFGSDYVALEAAGWIELYNPSVHRYMARRESVSDEWILSILTGESGEYIEYVFKAFKSDLIDDILDNPSSYTPFDKLATGWEDVPFVVGDDETLFVSAAKKFSNGELKEDWSDPTPFGGQDVVIDVIKSSGGDEFKKSKAGVVTPESIILTAKLYKGVREVTPTSIAWERIWNNNALSSTSFGTTESITILNTHVTGMAIFKCTQIFEGRTYISEYSILDIADGIDAKGLVTTSNTNTIIIKQDGTKIPATVSLRAISQNLTGPIHWYKNDVKILDTNGNPKTYTNDTFNINLADFVNGTQVTYKAEAQSDFLLDGTTKMSDTTTFYALAEANGGAPAVTMVLSNESHTVVLDEATGATTYDTAYTDVRVFEGATEVTSTWTITIDALYNVTASLGGTGARPIITVTGMNNGASQGSVTIKASKTGSTIYKQFSIARISDPVGAILLDIDSNAGGYSFSPTEQRAKTLTAELYVDGVIPTTGVTYKWYVDGSATYSSGGSTFNYSLNKTFTITPSMVSFMATVKCEATYKSVVYKKTINITDVKDARGLGILYSDADLTSLAVNQYPDPSWGYSSAGGTRNTVEWKQSVTGAIWMSIKKEGTGETWSIPTRIKGEKGNPGSNGNHMKNVFAWYSTAPGTPSGWNSTAKTTTTSSINLTWTDAPPAKPTGTTYLWMCQAEFTSLNAIVGAWSTPVQMSGQDGVGTNATISIGTVTTGAAGTNASVTNSGSASAATFNFTIPRGDKGADGTGGLGIVQMFLHESTSYSTAVANYTYPEFTLRNDTSTEKVYSVEFTSKARQDSSSQLDTIHSKIVTNPSSARIYSQEVTTVMPLGDVPSTGYPTFSKAYVKVAANSTVKVWQYSETFFGIKSLYYNRIDGIAYEIGTPPLVAVGGSGGGTSGGTSGGGTGSSGPTEGGGDPGNEFKIEG